MAMLMSKIQSEPPDVPVNSARVSAVESYVTIARREVLTVRQTAMRAAAAKHHWTLIGSVSQVADQLEDWFHNEAADGFNILASDVPDAVHRLCAHLVPELRARRTGTRRRRDQDKRDLPSPSIKAELPQIYFGIAPLRIRISRARSTMGAGVS